MLLQEPSLIVGTPLERVGVYLGAGVLHHHHPIRLVEVGEGKGFRRQFVEEDLLGSEVIGKGLMVVEVISREIGEDPSGEGGSTDPVLVYCNGRDLHEGVAAACLHHLVEVSLERQCVGSGEVTRCRLIVDADTDGGDQPDPVAQLAEELIEERGNGGLTIGPGDADEAELVGRVVVEISRHIPQDHVGMLDAYVGDPGAILVGDGLTDDRCGTAVECLVDESVSIGHQTAQGDEEVPLAHGARVGADLPDLDAVLPGDQLVGDAPHDFTKFHYLL